MEGLAAAGAVGVVEVVVGVSDDEKAIVVVAAVDERGGAVDPGGVDVVGVEIVQETAYMLGFTEPTSFYRYFKRVTGMTAKQYRDSRMVRSSPGRRVQRWYVRLRR